MSQSNVVYESLHQTYYYKLKFCLAGLCVQLNLCTWSQKNSSDIFFEVFPHYLLFIFVKQEKKIWIIEPKRFQMVCTRPRTSIIVGTLKGIVYYPVLHLHSKNNTHTHTLPSLLLWFNVALAGCWHSDRLSAPLAAFITTDGQFPFIKKHFRIRKFPTLF